MESILDVLLKKKSKKKCGKYVIPSLILFNFLWLNQHKSVYMCTFACKKITFTTLIQITYSLALQCWGCSRGCVCVMYCIVRIATLGRIYKGVFKKDHKNVHYEETMQI